MFKVIQEQEAALVRQGSLEVPFICVRKTSSAGNCQADRLRLAQRRQVNKPDPVPKLLALAAGQFDRQARFANAAWAD